jgi:hypothetical protein
MSRTTKTTANNNAPAGVTTQPKSKNLAAAKSATVMAMINVADSPMIQYKVFRSRLIKGRSKNLSFKFVVMPISTASFLDNLF